MNEAQIEALKTADEYLDKLKSGINKAVNLFANDKQERGCDYLALISKGIEWIVEVVSLTKESQKEEIEIQNINEHLESIVEALENEDYTLVGDLLNYEVLPILENVHEKIKESVK